MNPTVDVEKLADVQRVAVKLEHLPEQARLYIAGYTEGVASVSQLLTSAANAANNPSA